MQALIIIEASGKAKSWARITAAIGMPSRVVATGGHVCHFPDRLFPLGIDVRAGEFLDPGRKPDPERAERILSAISETPETCPIIIAMDNDVEGDVIAHDVIGLILARFPARSGRVVRVRPGPITNEGVRAALAAATRIAERRIVSDAVQGRARAVTDRWIGATFSKLAGVPVGRVRSAVLGATLLLNRAPDRLLDRPETGEITFQARAAVGGRPFVSRVALTGHEDPSRIEALAKLARRFSGLLVPGAVRPIMSLSAAVAPRIGTVRPFHTADALAYASRHHGVSAVAAMRGLQDAYQDGLISYPRTDGREMSAESASRVVMMGFACGLAGLETEVLSTEGRVRGGAGRIPDTHEALHPVLPLSTANSDRLRELVRRPVREPVGGWDRDGVRDLMVTLVARRAFEAAREITLERGMWRADNIAGIDPQEAEILEDLDWVREEGFNFPWTRSLSTGVRAWPTESVLLDLMATEGLGRPSTYATHLRTAIESGDIEEGVFPLPPRPSPAGMAALRRMPRSVWNPATCRMIESAMENAGNRLSEDEAAPLSERARHRVLAWFAKVPEEMRGPLSEALLSGQAGREAGGIAMSAPRDEASPLEFNTGLAEPTPFAT
ncbi:DNA topoisomerase [Defluviimonas salinarum]|uniref:DNA topoisomerase n=1 Tax=Defluviimonas salinarum TaxID=2992147 RepID=A0ABT3JAU3_9RHOB|nr:DNA topoisomerase [Defluviimonas salinarum]MCW3784653.1 DNA topoisomerase [Defluviimonas salinarum]